MFCQEIDKSRKAKKYKFSYIPVYTGLWPHGLFWALRRQKSDSTGKIIRRQYKDHVSNDVILIRM